MSGGLQYTDSFIDI